MNSNSIPLNIQSPSPQDIQRVFEFVVRTNIADYGEADTDLEDLQQDWRHIDLGKDAWLALDPTGKLVGYAAVLAWGQDLRYDFYGDPDGNTYEICQELLSRCEQRGKQIISGKTDSDDSIARCFISHSNQIDRKVILEAGFQPGRYFSQMQIDLEGTLPKPRWPEGVGVRNAIHGQDDYALHQLIERAFDRPERKPASFEEWKKHMLQPEIYDPDLWFLAIAQTELVGASLSFNYPSIGWVRQLGVEPEWQGRGIGAALLLHTFQAYQSLGQTKVGLSVESERPDAYEFYQKVGMRPAIQYDEYVKPFSPDL